MPPAGFVALTAIAARLQDGAWMVDEAKAHSDGIYRAGKRCKPGDFQTCFAEAQDVLRALVRG